MEINANNVIMEGGRTPKKRKTSSKNIPNKRGFVGNIKYNANKDFIKAISWGVFGAVIYPLIPTVIQAITEWDMSGAKGMATGVGTAAVLGLGLNKSEMAIGAICAAGTHLLYAKGTGPIEKLTNTQIFRMNPNSVIYHN
jgi:hypothetical protein